MSTQSVVYIQDAATQSVVTVGITGPQGPSGAGAATQGAIIYKPGGVSAGNVVATWAEVQAFITSLLGCCTVFVDDSITSPALVPGGSGLTECYGRVEFRDHLVDATAYSVLQIEDGATINNPFLFTTLEVRCNCKSSTPSIAFSGSTNGGYLQMREFAKLSNASTATQSAVLVPAGKTLSIELATECSFTQNVAHPLFSVPATAALIVDAFAGSHIDNQWATGAGNVTLTYDSSTLGAFTSPGTAATASGVSGTYTTGLLDVYPPASILQASAATGNTLRWSGSAWGPAALNLAGGANYVTGALPITNIGHGTDAQLLNTTTATPTWITVSGAFTIANTGVTTFTPGTAGQIYVSNATPTAGWTSLISYETTHGRFTAGGGGSDYKAVIGPYVGSETMGSAAWLLPNATAASATNYFARTDGTFLYLNDPFGNGSIYFYSAGSTQLASLSSSLLSLNSAALSLNSSATTPSIQSGTSATSLTVGTNKSGASLILQGDAATTVQTLASTGTELANLTTPTAGTGPRLVGASGRFSITDSDGTVRIF